MSDSPILQTAAYESALAGIDPHLLGVRSKIQFVQALNFRRAYPGSHFLRANGLQFSNADLDQATNDPAKLRQFHDSFARPDILLRSCFPQDPIRAVKYNSADDWRMIEDLIGRRLDTVVIASPSATYRLFLADSRDPELRYRVPISGTGCELARAIPMCGAIDRKSGEPWHFPKFAALTETPMLRVSVLLPLLPKQTAYVPQAPRVGEQIEKDAPRGFKRSIGRVTKRSGGNPFRTRAA